MLDIIFDPRFYGGVDYRVLSEKGLTYTYLTGKGMRETYNLSKNLLNINFSNDLLKKSLEHNNKIKKYKIPNLTFSNVFEKWGELIEIFDEFDYVYRFYEQPYQQALEEVVLKKCKDKSEAVELFKNPSLSKKMGFNGKEIYALNLLIDMGKLKLKIHDNAESFVRSLEIFGKFLAKKYDLSLNQALSLRKKEFESALKGKRPNVNLMNERLKGFALIPINKKWQCFFGKEYLFWKNRIEKDQPKIIKGDVSYRGKIRGKAVIHLDWIGTVSIPKGSVLVCGMTNPQIVPFLKNAAAIVTDEGGLTCHAAIISRELKIPCIVGTGNATRLIKDGDLVEVDAEKGVVKIINK